MRQVIAIALTVLTYAGLVYAGDDDFCVYFYKEPNYVDQAGFICGALSAGELVGRPNSNIPVVASIAAPHWMKLDLYTKKAYKGKRRTLRGANDKISPALNVQSFKLTHIKK
ncbi:hypothetical protein DFQ27_003393 [Actinomortierella ambigua]|uniref:Uncharacterized protein n=1 Tax=Actinomortierella ambigua TaxID=1343610 RepID=A0A9P6QI53_9FUNG|nr:hypothetical protein DFQ27_003393 [Actinomortierella ambigua]